MNVRALVQMGGAVESIVCGHVQGIRYITVKWWYFLKSDQSGINQVVPDTSCLLISFLVESVTCDFLCSILQN